MEFLHHSFFSLIQLGQDGSLVLIQRDGTTHPALSFHSGSVLCFVEVLLRYVAVKKWVKTNIVAGRNGNDICNKCLGTETYLSICLTWWWSTCSFFHVITRSEKDCNLYLVSDKKQAAQDDELLAMNLVPSRRGMGAAGGAHTPSTTHQRVWGFFNNFKRDPYTATAGALSKFYDAVCKLVLE